MDFAKFNETYLTPEERIVLRDFRIRRFKHPEIFYGEDAEEIQRIIIKEYLCKLSVNANKLKETA